MYIILRVIKDKGSDGCDKRGSCDCLEFFVSIYAVECIFMLVYAIFRIQHGWRASGQDSRREIKLNARYKVIATAIFGSILLALLIYTTLKDHARDECADDDRFNKIKDSALAALIVSGVSYVGIFLQAILVSWKLFRARVKSRYDPPLGSSDEEDDKEFIQFGAVKLNIIQRIMLLRRRERIERVMEANRFEDYNRRREELITQIRLIIGH